MPYILGITGGIGSGKTAATDRFKHHGIAIVDADEIARVVVTQGSPALAAISDYFGSSILLEDGNLDRTQLRTMIFQDPEKKQWLEALLHPIIRQNILAALASTPPPYTVLSAPLLFENGLDQITDRTLVIDCNESTQQQRASQRDNCSPDTIAAIMQQQLSRQARQTKADDIINNEGSLAALQHTIDQYHQQLCKALSET